MEITGRNRMPVEAKAKWVAALRSGQYKQAKGILYNASTDGYCCLGVLQHCLTGEVELRPGDDTYSSGNLIGDLPSNEWLEKHNIEFSAKGAVVSKPIFKINKAYISANELNDCLHYSFDRIADIVEEQVETF
jgi:hypothetical protein